MGDSSIGKFDRVRRNRDYERLDVITRRDSEQPIRVGIVERGA